VHTRPRDIRSRTWRARLHPHVRGGAARGAVPGVETRASPSRCSTRRAPGI
jgi:hypothetical protein